MRRIAICLLLFLGICSSCLAQNSLSGVVTDSLTEQAIPFATVYFSNTAIGTSANEKGEFTLKNFPSGQYKLVTSSLGYEPAEISVSFERSAQQIRILLNQKNEKLEPVVINSTIDQNPIDLRQFKKYFLGETRNASSCRILNQKNIALYYTSKNVFVASAKAPLRIENSALGYRLFFDLKSFEIDFKTSTLYYVGIPRFEPLVSKSESQQKRWNKERIRAYNGSFMQLVRSLRRGVIDTSFVIYERYRVKNRKRPSDEFLDKKIRYWRGQYYGNKGAIRANKTQGSKADFDSLVLYHRLKDQPKIIDSIGHRYTEARHLLDESGDHLVYTGTGVLYIIYKGEKKEFSYPVNKLYGDTAKFEQHSIVYFKNKKVAIYDNGYYEAKNLFFDGYMGWSEKIAEQLPLDYICPKEEDEY